jgi:hypothetical protein
MDTLNSQERCEVMSVVKELLELKRTSGSFTEEDVENILNTLPSNLQDIALAVYNEWLSKATNKAFNK